MLGGGIIKWEKVEMALEKGKKSTNYTDQITADVYLRSRQVIATYQHCTIRTNIQFAEKEGRSKSLMLSFYVDQC